MFCSASDACISKVLHACSQHDHPPQEKEGHRHPLRQYRQLWNQLKVVDGVLCHTYVPVPTSELVTVPILSASLQKQALLAIMM